MTTRAELITEARDWLNTPWRHQGRLKGIACDCVGFLIKVPAAVGIFAPDFNVTGYPRNPGADVLKKYLDLYLDVVRGRPRKIGDVLLLRPVHQIPHHVALLTSPTTMIHAIDEIRGVREHRLDDHWEKKIAAVYTYRGLED